MGEHWHVDENKGKRSINLTLRFTPKGDKNRYSWLFTHHVAVVTHAGVRYLPGTGRINKVVTVVAQIYFVPSWASWPWIVIEVIIFLLLLAAGYLLFRILAGGKEEEAADKPDEENQKEDNKE